MTERSELFRKLEAAARSHGRALDVPRGEDFTDLPVSDALAVDLFLHQINLLIEEHKATAKREAWKAHEAIEAEIRERKRANELAAELAALRSGMEQRIGDRVVAAVVAKLEPLGAAVDRLDELIEELGEPADDEPPSYRDPTPVRDTVVSLLDRLRERIAR